MSGPEISALQRSPSRDGRLGQYGGVGDRVCSGLVWESCSRLLRLGGVKWCEGPTGFERRGASRSQPKNRAPADTGMIQGTLAFEKLERLLDCPRSPAAV